METIAFYSYKGGVGRTFSLAYIARMLHDLHYDFNYIDLNDPDNQWLNISIMDFDLESPGLHNKFEINSENIGVGLVDYIYEFTQKGIIPESLMPFSFGIFNKTLLGSPYFEDDIRMFPAGNMLSDDYWNRLESINWHDLLYREDTKGVQFFLELKERIKEEFNPDFLLIDSGTGINGMSRISYSLLPDKVVFFIANNKENIDGVKMVLKSIQNAKRLPEQKPLDVIFALTGIHPDESDVYIMKPNGTSVNKEDDIVNEVLDGLNKDIGNQESYISRHDIHIIHSDRVLDSLKSVLIDTYGDPLPLTSDYNKLLFRIFPEDIVSKIFGVLKSQIKSYFDVGPLFIETVNERFASSRKKLMQCYTELVDIARDKAKVLDEVIDDILSGEKDKELYKRRYIHPNEDYTIPPEHDWIVKEHLVKDIEFAMALFEKYSEVVNNDSNLKIKKIRSMLIFMDRSYFKEKGLDLSNKRMQIKKEINDLFNHEWILTSDFFNREPELFFSAMNYLYKYVLNNIFNNGWITLDNFFNKDPYRFFSIMMNLKRLDDLNKPFADGWISEKDLLDKNSNLFISVMDKLGKIKDLDKFFADGYISAKDLFYKNPRLFFSVAKKHGKSDYINKPFDEGWIYDLFEESPHLFFSMMKELGKENQAENMLNNALEHALAKEDYNELYRVSDKYRILGRKKELKEKMDKSNKLDSPIVEKVLGDIEDLGEDIPF